MASINCGVFDDVEKMTNLMVTAPKKPKLTGICPIVLIDFEFHETPKIKTPLFLKTRWRSDNIFSKGFCSNPQRNLN
jgi:hypothetical protein